MRLVYALVVVLVSALALFIYNTWGLAGTAVLLAGLGTAAVISWIVLRRAKMRLAARLEGMTDAQIVASLASLDQGLRTEIIGLMRENPEKYHAVLLLLNQR